MTELKIRDIAPDDHRLIVELNAKVVKWTSPMSEGQLQKLIALATYQKVLTANSQVVGFLLAMAQGSLYENDNFRWFDARYKNFLYIDRVVIDSSVVDSGLGTFFYRDVISHADMESFECLVCEYSLNPTNETSMFFHRKMGFQEVGIRRLRNSGKEVSLQLRSLEAS